MVVNQSKYSRNITHPLVFGAKIIQNAVMNTEQEQINQQTLKALEEISAHIPSDPLGLFAFPQDHLIGEKLDQLPKMIDKSIEEKPLQ